MTGEIFYNRRGEIMIEVHTSYGRDVMGPFESYKDAQERLAEAKNEDAWNV